MKEYQVVLMSGMPGSGKSYIAKQLAKQQQRTYFSSDVYRERLYKSTRHDVVGNEVGEPHSLLANKAMKQDILEAVQSKQQIVVDATHLKFDRKALLEELRAVTDWVVMILVRTSVPSIKKRIQNRTIINSKGETAFQACMRIRSYFEVGFKKGTHSWPTEKDDQVAIIEFSND